MKSKLTILVTGATGVIGAEVSAALVKRSGVEARVGLRTPSKRAELPKGVDVVPFDFEDPASIDAALRGVDKIFLLTPGGPLGPGYTRAMTERLDSTDVTHIVKQSSFTPRREPQAPTDLWALEAEEAILETGCSWTSLEPPWVDQNFTRGYFTHMVARRTLTLPFGDGKSAWIDGRDVAAVAVRALCEPGHEGKRYCLTGPEAISIGQIADILSEVTGEDVEYRHLTDEEWIEMSVAEGAPLEIAKATLALISKTRDGYAEDVTDDFQTVCKRPPKSFETFAREHRSQLLALMNS